jgi:hypothetical protein
VNVTCFKVTDSKICRNLYISYSCVERTRINEAGIS